MHLVFLILILFSIQVNAGAGLDLGYTTLTDSYTQNSTGSNTRSLYRLTPYLGLDRADRFMLGWSMIGGTFSDTVSGTATTVTTSDNGPTILWNMTKSKIWTLSYTYGMSSKSSYTSGATTEAWEGTSSLIELGYAPPISETMSLGLRIGSYQTTATKKIVTTTITDISYTRTMLVPMIYFSWRPD